MLGAHGKGVRCLEETQENKKVPMDTEQWWPPATFRGHTALHMDGSETPNTNERFCTTRQSSELKRAGRARR